MFLHDYLDTVPCVSEGNTNPRNGIMRIGGNL